MSVYSKTYKIEKYGSEVLRVPCSTVSKFDRNLKKIVDKMLKTMYSENGVGLAAPQVGISKRIIVIDTDWPSERYKNENPNNQEPDYNPIVMINPVIVYHEGKMESPEGCLSFPGVFFSVTRAKKIVVKFQDINGKEHRIESDGDLFCRCVQHEIDHLNGQLFVDIASDKAFALEELEKFGLGGINSPPPFIL